MIGYDFGMHQAGVLLRLLTLLFLIMIVLHLRAIGVNRPYLCDYVCRKRNSHRYEQDQFVHG